MKLAETENDLEKKKVLRNQIHVIKKVFFLITIFIKETLPILNSRVKDALFDFYKKSCFFMDVYMNLKF